MFDWMDESAKHPKINLNPKRKRWKVNKFLNQKKKVSLFYMDLQGMLSRPESGSPDLMCRQTTAYPLGQDQVGTQDFDICLTTNKI